MIKINSYNYHIVLPVIEKFLPQERGFEEYILMFKDIIALDDLHDKGNELALEEINNFYNLINSAILEREIIIPDGYLTQLEQDIKRPVGRPTNTAVSKGVDKTISDINPLLNEEKPDLKHIENTVSPPYIVKKLTTHTPPANHLKKNGKTSATTRPTYTLAETDKQTLKGLELPLRKQYIYKEIRQNFGSPINTDKLQNFGVNRFARYLENTYPNGFKKTEIKTILNLVLNYDKISLV